MTGFRFSVAARADLLDIAAHTLETWGAAQASRYLDQLQACCQAVTESPVRARPCDDVRPGYFRITEGRHVLFFARHLSDDDELE
jgi:toxin ParE1/3/4